MQIIKNQLIQIKGTDLLNDTSIIVIPRQTMGTPGILLSQEIPNIAITMKITCSFDCDCKPFVWIGDKCKQKMLDHQMLINGKNIVKLPKYQLVDTIRVGIFFSNPKLTNRLIIKNIEINMQQLTSVHKRKEYCLNDSSDLSDVLAQKAGFSYTQYFPQKTQNYPHRILRVDYDVTDSQIEQLKQQLMY